MVSVPPFAAAAESEMAACRDEAFRSLSLSFSGNHYARGATRDARSGVRARGIARHPLLSARQANTVVAVTNPHTGAAVGRRVYQHSHSRARTRVRWFVLSRRGGARAEE
jgi:hypothetical protein